MSTSARADSPTHRRIQDLVSAAREYSTAAVMLHAAVAQHLGIGLTELKTLDILQRLGMQTAGQIGQVTGLKPSSVTSLVERLRRRGYVTHRRDPADRRRVLIRATARLGSEIAPLFAGVNRRMRSHFEKYGEVQAHLIQECFRRAAQALREETAMISQPEHRINKRRGNRRAPPA